MSTGYLRLGDISLFLKQLCNNMNIFENKETSITLVQSAAFTCLEMEHRLKCSKHILYHSHLPGRPASAASLPISSVGQGF